MKEEKNPLVRLAKYCAEVERCTRDVLQKLAAWNIDELEWNPVLDELRKNGFLNDTRYAQSFVTEKWNIYQWGKIKIRHQLESKDIPPALIEQALTSIDPEEYARVIHALLAAKWESLASDPSPAAAKKIAFFAAQRGFEEDLVEDWLANHFINL